MDGFRNSSETRPASQKNTLGRRPCSLGCHFFFWGGGGGATICCCSLSLAVFGVFLWFEMADMAVL